MKCGGCGLRINRRHRLRSTYVHAECENHLYCTGIYRSCSDFPTCSCFVLGGDYPPHGLRDHCVGDETREHVSFVCIDCYNDKFSGPSPDSRDFGPTESEDDDERLFEDCGKFAQRSRAQWEEFMRADGSRDERGSDDGIRITGWMCAMYVVDEVSKIVCRPT